MEYGWCSDALLQRASAAVEATTLRLYQLRSDQVQRIVTACGED